MQPDRRVRSQDLAIVSFLALSLGLTSGASCNKTETAKASDRGAAAALERADEAASPAAAKAKPAPAPAVPTGPVDVDVPGVDTDKMTDAEKAKFSKALDSLPSPCGKAHSLRTSVKTDSSCKRAPFAARFVRLLSDEKLGLTDQELRELYDGRYRPTAKPVEFNLTQAPFDGPEDAKVVLVEFFDYACPHCAAFKPVLEELVEKYPNDVVVYYKNFPLGGHPNSGPAAQAAVAASKQGKFKEMHALLFANQDAHDIDDLRDYAEKIGLDMARFTKDFQAAASVVSADRNEGIKGGLQGTPTVFINGRLVDRLFFLADYIEEEIAVNQ